MSVIRLEDHLYEKVKNRAKMENMKIGNLLNEMVKFYFYHKENELDHKLESYLFEQFKKMDKHLSSIMIRQAQDVCKIFMGQVQAIKIFLESRGESMSESEIREELDRLGYTYFNDYWKKKKD